MTTARAGYLCPFVFAILCYSLPHPACAQDGGYCTPRSVALGDSIHFHISSVRSKFDLSVYRYGSTKELVTVIRNCQGQYLTTPESSFVKGCRWPVTQSLKIQDNWQSGVYAVEYSLENNIAPIEFVVHERLPGSKSKIVVSLSASTWQAYNDWGGKSLYNFSSLGDTAAHCVSFERPISTSLMGGHDQSFERYGAKLTAWLAKEHIPVEYILNTDLDHDPTLLKHYDIFCVVGHDEYWSRPEREAVQEFLLIGKRVIILGGNTCWWQTRYDDSAQTLTCYKNLNTDPFTDHRNDLVTVNWGDTPVDEPENTLTGVSWGVGGYVNDDTFLLKKSGYGGYRVWNAQHWIYRGTDLDDGDSFGYDHSIVGYEVDGAIFNWNSGFPMPSSQDLTPKEFQILGISPAAASGAAFGLRHATMGMFTTVHGGAVFNAATTNWVDGLDGDEHVERITKNVFAQFAKTYFPPTVELWFPYRFRVDSLPYDVEYVNSRRITIQKGDTTYFHIVASDPFGERLEYEWLVNGEVASEESMFAWASTDKAFLFGKPAIVEVRVKNSHDSTTLQWEIYRNAGLKIVSRPHTANQKPKSSYAYKLDVVASGKSKVHYTLVKSPTWLSLDTTGTVRGTVAEIAGMYAVVVRADDEAGNSDTQSFTVSVASPTLVHREPVQMITDVLAAYPNPVKEDALISCHLTVGATASLNIFSSDGRIVRSIVQSKHVPPGTFQASWNRKNDSGVDVPNGAYWAVLNLGIEGEQKEKVFVHELSVRK